MKTFAEFNNPKTIPQVFIIESLRFEDEDDGTLEGKVLADVLHMCGKKPIYYYFRTEKELIALAQKFDESGYRYLHLSCHGNNKSVASTLDSIGFERLSNIFRGKLKRRRLFASACEVGTEHFSDLIGKANPGMHSIAAPVDSIHFDVAVAFWSAFYVKAFRTDHRAMKAAHIASILRSLSELFGTRVHWSRADSDDNWTHEVIGTKPLSNKRG